MTSTGPPVAVALMPGRPAGDEDRAQRRMESVIGWVLRVGVVASVAVVLAGLGLTFAQHPSYAHLRGGISYHQLTGPSSRFPHSLAAVGHAIASGSGQGLIALGIFLLILTPVLRVAAGVAGFAVQRDVPMTLVTATVLAVLVLSFFLGGL